ncbi:MAG TPA: C1 family peptidase [Solirubrobacterales bacterium]|nr:C1 family peptidase [Solirubrobacterales bacterium]
MTRKIQGYGWVPDLPDGRDLLYAAPLKPLAKLPPRVDLRSKCPRVYDQGQLGSCTANAIGAALQFDQIKQRRKDFIPSRLFIYYNERAMEGTIDSDSGAMIRDGIKSVAKQGSCKEENWPYDISEFRTKPPRPCYAEGKQNQAIRYLSVAQSLSQMKGCLAEGYPFVFGFVVYESFETAAVAKTGHAPMPKANEEPLGGHAVLAVGYDESKQWFIVRNSWGTGWGMRGYFTLPYPYLTQPSLARDFWTIREVEGTAAARRRKAKGRKAKGFKR